jgi:Zn-dependent peptidase ImmA (M78 family)
MHELSHAICKHQLKELECNIAGIAIPLRDYDHKQEAEAEHLGACLQLPRKSLVHHYCVLKKSADQIADIFNASKKMVSFRLAVTGVSKLKFKR